ncbi:hypothetical protein N7540_011794 [Penicillium herquei]|nr:hypothetical protein N7540_011794 [Penicillium herquei]
MNIDREQHMLEFSSRFDPIKDAIAAGSEDTLVLQTKEPQTKMTISDDQSEGSTIKKRKLMALANVSTHAGTIPKRSAYQLAVDTRLTLPPLLCMSSYPFVLAEDRTSNLRIL